MLPRQFNNSRRNPLEQVSGRIGTTNLPLIGIRVVQGLNAVEIVPGELAGLPEEVQEGIAHELARQEGLATVQDYVLAEQLTVSRVVERPIPSTHMFCTRLKCKLSKDACGKRALWDMECGKCADKPKKAPKDAPKCICGSTRINPKGGVVRCLDCNRTTFKTPTRRIRKTYANP